MTRPIQATISIPALAANLARVRHYAPHARVWSVVKANGYGHGLANALEGFAHSDGLALLEFDYARRLREAGWRGPILMLEGPFDEGDVVTARTWNLSLALHRPVQLDWLARSGGAPIDVWLKFNSGMNRLGMDAFALRRCQLLLQQQASRHGVATVGYMTHFANADRPGGLDLAADAFEAACSALPGPRSTANSAAVIDHPRTHLDWVRPGIMLYGATPIAGRPAADFGLRAGMRLTSRLIAVQQVRAGDTVGYGSLFQARQDTRIGVVACGYADGYPRHAPVGTPVWVAGRRLPLAGRVAMDMMMVDLDGAPEVDVGAPVELWGDHLPIDEVGEQAGTLGYELMCALAARVPVVVER